MSWSHSPAASVAVVWHNQLEPWTLHQQTGWFSSNFSALFRMHELLF